MKNYTTQNTHKHSLLMHFSAIMYCILILFQHKLATEIAIIPTLTISNHLNYEIQRTYTVDTYRIIIVNSRRYCIIFFNIACYSYKDNFSLINKNRLES